MNANKKKRFRNAEDMVNIRKCPNMSFLIENLYSSEQSLYKMT